jgi:hypothetical protein
MARVAEVPASEAGWTVRLACLSGPRMMEKLTGRVPEPCRGDGSRIARRVRLPRAMRFALGRRSMERRVEDGGKR